jgi:hypothetical protein
MQKALDSISSIRERKRKRERERERERKQTQRNRFKGFDSHECGGK